MLIGAAALGPLGFSAMSNPVIVVLGAGPGVGGSVARRFGQAGYDPALISREPDQLQALGEQLQSEGFTTGWTALDLTDADAVAAAVTRFGRHGGTIDHLHFNPSAFRQKTPLELTVDDLLDDVRLGVAAILPALQAARPFMPAGSRITATGSAAANNPWNEAASLGVQKAGLRNLMKSIDTTLAPDGIRAVTVTVTGTLGAGTPFDAVHVAEAIFAAAQTDAEFWATEVVFKGHRPSDA
jgi:NAD(P)-dependent dehydrogenase (short-subunit alcohol dehydrogenase family)